MKSPIVVVGAGAAGIIAAWKAASMGADVVLLEKTERIGTKILISGGGKCNITHAGSIDSVLRAFRPNEARFLRGPMYRFTNEHILELLHSHGLRTYVRENGRVFPVDQTAKDVVQILERCLREVKVPIRTGNAVTDLVAIGGRMEKVVSEKATILSNHVIVSVGGSSYPKSGTTGDGYPWMLSLGHTLQPIRAALAPMELGVSGIKKWAGIALRDCVLKAKLNGREIARWREDLLFTHRGVSGPCALGISREVAEFWHEGAAELQIDVCPKLNFEVVQQDLQNQKAKFPNRIATHLVQGFIPNNLVDDFLEQAEICPDSKLQQVSKKQLNVLANQLKAWSIGTVKEVLLDKGEVVAGGVDLSEVDPQTRRSQKVEGLYLCGEILDVDGPVGGYNLQAAWSTGYVAGESAARAWLD